MDYNKRQRRRQDWMAQGYSNKIMKYTSGSIAHHLFNILFNDIDGLKDEIGISCTNVAYLPLPDNVPAEMADVSFTFQSVLSLLPLLFLLSSFHFDSVQLINFSNLTL